jgi:methyltransferase (TIGR00027 family)
MNRFPHNPAVKQNAFIKLRLLIVFFTLGLAQAVAYGVEPGKPSFTAEAAAAFRAIAAMDPDEKIRNPDYLAKKFVSPEFWKKIDLDLNHMETSKAYFEASKAYIDVMQWTVYYLVNARTKHIDGILKGEAVKGIKQVVILGAGYDSRAYRFRDILPGVRFFEVDLPAMIARKENLVANFMGSLPDSVVYVSIDFNSQSLENVLKKAGYKSTQKTFFIWEAVTMYITEQGIDNTLRLIAEHSAPGSSILFDYVLKPVIDGTSRDYICKQIATMVASIGEPMIFGIKEGKAEQFVNQRGFVVLSHLSPEELTKKYLVRSDGSIDGPIPKCFRILHVSVPSSPAKKN